MTELQKPYDESKLSNNASTHVSDTEESLLEYFLKSYIILEWGPNPLSFTIMTTVIAENGEKLYRRRERKREEESEGRTGEGEREKDRKKETEKKKKLEDKAENKGITRKEYNEVIFLFCTRQGYFSKGI